MAKKTLAQRADRHELYQLSVQVPEADVAFLHRTFKKRFGRSPLTFREDFAGTAHLACAWVESHRKREAWCVDLDEEVTAWGKKHNIAKLGKKASRIRQEIGDVRKVRKPRVDVQAAFNFSYCCFHERAELVEYFRAVHGSIADEGHFVLDIHGGAEALDEMVERKKIDDLPQEFRGTRYVWRQEEFDPLSSKTKRHIGFEFRDGSSKKKAFTYDWRIWSPPEVRDALTEAGFSSVDFYWEGTDLETREGNGVYKKARKGENDPSWITYIVAVR